MIAFKNTLILGQDHGYGNFKTAGTVTPTAVTKYSSRPLFGGNILEYNDNFYLIGEGHKDFIADKTADEDFYILTLYGIGRELRRQGETEGNIHIAAGLPLTWWHNQHSSFEKYLTKNEYVEFRLNDISYKVNITGATVLPQGYSAVYDHLSEMTGDNMIVDIGNGTINLMRVKNKKAIEDSSHTEGLGVNQCVIGMMNDVNNFGAVSVDESVIEDFIKTGNAEVSEKYIPVMQRAAENYCSRVFSMLRKYGYDKDFMKLYIVGGGARVIERFSPENDNSRVIIINDICAAAKGYEFMAKRILEASTR